MTATAKTAAPAKVSAPAKTPKAAPKVGGQPRHATLDVRWLDVWRIIPDPDNERPYPTLENDPDLQGLMDNIRERGLMEPLLVYADAEVEGYVLLSGHRRHAAVSALGWARVMVRTTDRPESAANRHLDRLTSNLQRKGVGPIETARTLQRILQVAPAMTQTALAQQLGMSQPRAANYLRLLDLPPEVQTLLDEGKLTMGHALALLGVEGAHYKYDWKKSGPDAYTPDMDRAAHIAHYAKFAVANGLSVRDLEKAVENANTNSRYARTARENALTQEAETKVEMQRIERANEAHNLEVVKAVAEGKPAPPLPPELDAASQELASRLEREQLRQQREAENVRNEQRRKVAQETVRQALAFSVSDHSQLKLLRLAAMGLLDWAYRYSKPDGLPAKQQVISQIEKAKFQAGLLELMCKIAAANVNVDWQGMVRNSDYSAGFGYSTWADGQFQLNKLIEAAWAAQGLADDPPTAEPPSGDPFPEPALSEDEMNDLPSEVANHG